MSRVGLGPRNLIGTIDWSADGSDHFEQVSRACRSVGVGLVGVSISYVYAVCEGETDLLGIYDQSVSQLGKGEKKLGEGEASIC